MISRPGRTFPVHCTRLSVLGNSTAPCSRAPPRGLLVDLALMCIDFESVQSHLIMIYGAENRSPVAPRRRPITAPAPLAGAISHHWSGLRQTERLATGNLMPTTQPTLSTMRRKSTQVAGTGVTFGIIALVEEDLGFLLAFVAKRSLGGRASSYAHKLDRSVRSFSDQAYHPKGQPGQAEVHPPLLYRGRTLFAQKICSLSHTLDT